MRERDVIVVGKRGGLCLAYIVFSLVRNRDSRFCKADKLDFSLREIIGLVGY